MAQVDSSPIYLEDGGGAVDGGVEGCFKKRTHVEIMVSFKIDDFDSLFPKPAELFQHGEVMAEWDVGITDPELEQVPQYKKSIGVSRKCCEKIEEESVIFVVFAP